jgi:hypothetical protein
MKKELQLQQFLFNPNRGVLDILLPIKTKKAPFPAAFFNL